MGLLHAANRAAHLHEQHPTLYLSSYARHACPLDTAAGEEQVRRNRLCGLQYRNSHFHAAGRMAVLAGLPGWLLSQEVSKHPSYTSTLAKIEELKAKTVQGESLKAGESPVLVYDCVHSYLGNGATGVVTVHTFRTAKEAGQLAKRDPLPYGQVSLWNEKLGCAYELIPRLPSDIVAINCFNPDLDPIWESFAADRNDVLLAKNYHYESLVVSGKRRIVVFPVGTIFGN